MNPTTLTMAGHLAHAGAARLRGLRPGCLPYQGRLRHPPGLHLDQGRHCRDHHVRGARPQEPSAPASFELSP